VGVSIAVGSAALVRRARSELAHAELRLQDMRRERDRVNDALRRREAELIRGGRPRSDPARHDQAGRSGEGLLLSRRDEDADGRLDLVCAHGFGDDPERGSIVQRDQIVREDTPTP
jgi:hypothetical protein